MSNSPDGGQDKFDRARAPFSRKRRRAPYLVRMIKPNLIASHDWHVQPNCQRSLRAPRLSGTLGSSPRYCYRSVPRHRCRSVLELDALDRKGFEQEKVPNRSKSRNRFFGARCASLRGIRRFCANLLKVLKHPPSVKVET